MGNKHSKRKSENHASGTDADQQQASPTRKPSKPIQRMASKPKSVASQHQDVSPSQSPKKQKSKSNSNPPPKATSPVPSPQQAKIEPLSRQTQASSPQHTQPQTMSPSPAAMAAAQTFSPKFTNLVASNLDPQLHTTMSTTDSTAEPTPNPTSTATPSPHSDRRVMAAPKQQKRLQSRANIVRTPQAKPRDDSHAVAPSLESRVKELQLLLEETEFERAKAVAALGTGDGINVLLEKERENFERVRKDDAARYERQIEELSKQLEAERRRSVAHNRRSLRTVRPVGDLTDTPQQTPHLPPQESPRTTPRTTPRAAASTKPKDDDLQAQLQREIRLREDAEAALATFIKNADADSRAHEEDMRKKLQKSEENERRLKEQLKAAERRVSQANEKRATLTAAQLEKRDLENTVEKQKARIAELEQLVVTLETQVQQLEQDHATLSASLDEALANAGSSEAAGNAKEDLKMKIMARKGNGAADPKDQLKMKILGRKQGD